MNNTFCRKIFDPNYVYHCAARKIGEQYELRGMIGLISDCYLSEHNFDINKPYSTKSLYYNYKKNILVLTYTDETYIGQTFINGMADIRFDMLAQEDDTRNFFKTMGDELTVIDFFTGKQLNPNYEMVMQYIKMVIETNKELDRHRQTIEQYKERYSKLRQETGELYCTSPSTSYKKAVHLLDALIEEVEGTFGLSYEEKLSEIQNYSYLDQCEESLLNIFGLYLYVLKYGMEHKRFLKRGSAMISLCFNQTVNQMRKFIAENEGIVDRYIDYMQLTPNDRENLMYLLSQEQLITNGNNIGDDLFC